MAYIVEVRVFLERTKWKSAFIFKNRIFIILAKNSSAKKISLKLAKLSRNQITEISSIAVQICHLVLLRNYETAKI